MPEEDGGKQKKRDPGQFAIWEPEQDRGIRPLGNFERLIRSLKVDLKINEFWNTLANAKKTELLNIKKEKNKDKLKRQLEALVENKAVGELVAPLMLEDSEKALSLLENEKLPPFKKYIQKRLKEKGKKAVDAEAEEQQKKKREAVEEKKRQERNNLKKANQTLTSINNLMSEILAGKFKDHSTVTGVAHGATVPVPIPARPKPMAPLFKTSHSSTRPPEKQPPPQKPPKRKRPTSPAKRPTGPAKRPTGAAKRPTDPAKAPNRKNSGAGGSGLSLKEKAKSQGVLPWAVQRKIVSPEKQPPSPPSEQQESSKQRRKRPVPRS